MDANLESKKFPSLGYLRSMGVDFKPSLNHKVQSGHKVFNILNSPIIATIAPKIDCVWENGGPPKFHKTAALVKKMQESDELRLSPTYPTKSSFHTIAKKQVNKAKSDMNQVKLVGKFSKKFIKSSKK